MGCAVESFEFVLFEVFWYSRMYIFIKIGKFLNNISSKNFFASFSLSSPFETLKIFVLVCLMVSHKSLRSYLFSFFLFFLFFRPSSYNCPIFGFDYSFFPCAYLLLNAFVNLKFYLLYFKKLFIFRERGREGEREGKKHQCVIASCTSPPGDLASNPGMCPDW